MGASGQEDFISRVRSRSPSPVRTQAPLPESPSHSTLYSSNFGSSSSATSSPSKSPIKVEVKASPENNLKDTNNSAKYMSDENSIHTEDEIQVESSSEDKDICQPNLLLTQKRKNWATTTISSKNPTSAKEIDEQNVKSQSQLKENSSRKDTVKVIK